MSTRAQEKGRVLITLLRDNFREPEPYRGRGMTRKCVAIRCDDAMAEAFRVGVIVGLEHAPSGEMPIGPPTADSMGTDAILYWPDTAWPADEKGA